MTTAAPRTHLVLLHPPLGRPTGEWTGHLLPGFVERADGCMCGVDPAGVSHPRAFMAVESGEVSAPERGHSRGSCVLAGFGSGNLEPTTASWADDGDRGGRWDARWGNGTDSACNRVSGT